MTTDLKRMYQSMIEQEASLELENFTDKWDEK
ncbi:MAG: hypothetical protein ACI9CO_001322 [Candidatus Azotimanducaceae bacterium]|jgi:hypothetical protein